uniref:Uncharacterized protein n=1 Tax=Globisporangium ultimum (strain ATCC 200006 / CBS 805.95 / DAOM BR144) TaxID=431595 RepID=K3WB28_GLOUD
MEVGDDKSLRPRYLKERSATHADLSVGVVSESLTVPQSKAGAFLLSVMAKARGYNFNDIRRVPFDPMRGANTNTLSYANRKKEQGVPLRVASPSRRLGIMSRGDSRLLLGDQVDENKAADKSQEQSSIETLIHDMGLQRQQIHKQMEVLHEIQLRLTEVEYDHLAQAQLCKALVERNFLKEVVSAMREFRFHIGLQQHISVFTCS